MKSEISEETDTIIFVGGLWLVLVFIVSLLAIIYLTKGF